jgi:hypothetical protein
MVGIGPKFFIVFPILILLLFAVIAGLILFIRLCIKKPWAAVIIASVLIAILVPFFVLRLNPHRRIVSYSQQAVPFTLSEAQSQEPIAAIWSPGIEDQFKADVYPSKISAVRSLGLRIGKPVRQVFDDQAFPAGFILFQGAHERDVLEQFGQAIATAFPQIKWTIKPETAAVQDNEVGIRLDLANIQTLPCPWQPKSQINSGTVSETVLSQDRQTSIDADFVEKPWVDDFSGFLNTNPNSRLLIAKSSESCLSESEANQQAMNDACKQVGPLLTNIRNPVKLSYNDIRESDMILDRFVQSFDGAAGKIWRQALLIDASTDKLTQLARREADMAQARRMNWARMFFSIAGLLVLITVVYVFLNAATKGYYAWSLRIAGIVLALIVIFLLLA